METNKIYIDIQSLFDIRQGTLCLLHEDKEQLANYLVSEDYNFREIDIFPNTLEQVYAIKESQGDIEILKNSTITYLLNVLKSKVSNIEKRNAHFNEKKAIEIIVNTYPFILYESLVEDFQNLLFYKLGKEALISVIRMPPKEVSPYFIKTSSVITAFIYDYTTWMNEHSQTLTTQKLPDTLIYFPTLYKHLPTQEDKEHIKKLGFKDVFSYTEFITSPACNISYLPIVFYSNLPTATSYLGKFDVNLQSESLTKQSDENVDLSKVDLSVLDEKKE